MNIAVRREEKEIFSIFFVSSLNRPNKKWTEHNATIITRMANDFNHNFRWEMAIFCCSRIRFVAKNRLFRISSALFSLLFLRRTSFYRIRRRTNFIQWICFCLHSFAAICLLSLLNSLFSKCRRHVLIWILGRFASIECDKRPTAQWKLLHSMPTTKMTKQKSIIFRGDDEKQSRKKREFREMKNPCETNKFHVCKHHSNEEKKCRGERREKPQLKKKKKLLVSCSNEIRLRLSHSGAYINANNRRSFLFTNDGFSFCLLPTKKPHNEIRWTDKDSRAGASDSTETMPTTETTFVPGDNYRFRIFR